MEITKETTHTWHSDSDDKVFLLEKLNIRACTQFAKCIIVFSAALKKVGSFSQHGPGQRERELTVGLSWVLKWF